MKEFFKPNPYINSMWDQKDREFYWSGCKDGMVIGVILVVCVCGLVVTVKDWTRMVKGENPGKQH